MLILAIIWAVFSGAAIAVGVESQTTWRKVFNLSSTVDGVRRLLLMGGTIIGAGTILWTFYYNVRSNGIIVLGAWLATFLIGRLFVEIMKRRDVYDDAPVARPLSNTPSAAGESFAAQNLTASSNMNKLPDIGEVEEIEANFQMWERSDPNALATEDVAAAEDATGMERVPAEDTSAPGPIQPPVQEPPMDLDETQSAQYNEIFRRINK